MVMERCTTISAFALILLSVACSNNSGPDQVAQEASVPVAPKGVNEVVKPREAKGRPPVIDLSTPERLLVSMKDVIATDVLDSMRVFCHPEATVGSPTQLMCGISTEDMDQIDKFRYWFCSARLDSAVVHNGDTARMPLTLAPGDPERERHAFLVLVKREGTYYLNDLAWQRRP